MQAGPPQPALPTWDVSAGKTCKLSLHSHRISWKFSLLLSTSLKHMCGKYLFQLELKDAWRTYTVHIMFVLGGCVNELRCFACLNFLLATLGHWSFSSPLEGKFEHNCGKVMTLSWCELGAFMSSVQLKNKTKQKTHIPSLFTASDRGFVASVLAWLAQSSHATYRMWLVATYRNAGCVSCLCSESYPQGHFKS